MVDFAGLLGLLHNHGVLFVIIGGAAATAHGSTRLTLDLDIVYERSPENIAHLAGACLCLDLPTLIRVKRAAGRPKDLEAIAELEGLRRERQD